jgi:branched-chain amino acid transport system ATP-binding protein
MLEVSELEVWYGELPALHDVSLELPAGSVRAVIGPNGAGKSTLLSCIAGRLRLARGTIRLDGQEISQLPPHEIVARGVSLSPQDREVFGPLNVLENLELGAYVNRRDRARVQSRLGYVLDTFPVLGERLKMRSDALSGGQQQMLAIGRALMAEPRLLMLDEPSAGVAPIVVDAIFDVVQTLAATGITLLVAEQNAIRALDIAEYAYVLTTGHVAQAGPAAELRTDQNLEAAYMGADREKK